MDAAMRLLSDPTEAFAQYGWYLVGAAVLYFYVLRPYVDGEVARRKLAEANDPSRRRTLDEKRAAAIADRQASLDKAAKEGGWVFLQNVHLMESWLPKLERSLEIAAETGHDDFRCFLSAEAPPLPTQQSVPEGSKCPCTPQPSVMMRALPPCVR